MIDFKKEGIKAVILDMDGVLWKGTEPIGDLPAIFNKFTQNKLPVILATNNAMSTVDQYIHKMLVMGVTLQEWQIATSGQAVVFYLNQKYPRNSRIYVIGMDGLKTMLIDAGYILCDSAVAAVVVGVDREITYEKIKVANKLIREGAEFIGTNRDKTFPTPEGLQPGAGAIIASVAAASETEPIFVGKPGRILMDLSLSRFSGISREQVLIVGDRLDTDIAAGQNYGCKTALVLTGVTTSEMANTWQPKPDFIFNNLSEIVGA
jgi:4-nitrophenyl phosphatase